MTVVKKPDNGSNPRKKNDPRDIPGMAAMIWQPGQSGNPKGRTPGTTIEALILKMLDHTVGEGEDAMTRMEMLATILIDEALNRRDYRIIRDLLDRLWPKPIRLQGDPDFPLLPEPEPSDLSKLSDEELEQLMKLRDKMRRVSSE